ncbi:MAG: hypothetical protein COU40_03430 [Candidatus Moranbacteria bacterium CG10_big_fil_rev_8_21_14_0_10_35_21]|nr:MAG: hypothetical protein COU40_03430 [Candidatus Moranbacteria bacterium CG10_big_fil_rev_8_21_14_0_10_35_21]PJA88364.1 MAG: hypothetical protein CO139_03555 [Candidatus Moranbacteria bacterium CG_4_9_14_3_um_filter_36_9]
METLHSKKITKATSTSATQQIIDIAEVKEDTVVLKNGSFRAILTVSAINYDLKSSDEQEAIINQYQNFLNSLDFPTQIIISSRKINMDKYLDFLETKEKSQPNELLRLQISEYRNFISELISVSNIMDKNFYIVVPFAPLENTEAGFFSKMFTIFNPRKGILQKRENFETYRSQLYQRVDHITASLSGIGVRVIPLKTQEIIELLYNSYNPQVFTPTDLADISKLDLKNQLN